VAAAVSPITSVNGDTILYNIIKHNNDFQTNIRNPIPITVEKLYKAKTPIFFVTVDEKTIY